MLIVLYKPGIILVIRVSFDKKHHFFPEEEKLAGKADFELAYQLALVF